MKKTLFFILFIPLVIFSQNLKVTSIDPITDSSQGAFFYPSFSNDGTKIIFTSESYKGLWLHDLKTQNTTQINNLTGSGYKPIFIGNDESIIFRTDNFSNDGRTSSLRKVELNSKNETILIDFTRELSAPLYAVEDMGINHRGLDILVSEQFLHRANVITCFQQMSRKTVPKSVRTDRLINLCELHRRPNCPLKPAGIQMMTADDPAARIG